MVINIYRTNNIILNNIRKQSQNSSLNFEKLSTGTKINRASDAPSEILRISKLESSIRMSQVSQKNIQEGITLLQIMDSSLSNIESISQRLYELAVHYQNGSLSSQDRHGAQKEAEALYKEINHIIENTEFNGIKVFDKGQFIIKTGSGYNDEYTIRVNDFKINEEKPTNIKNHILEVPTGYVENYQVNGYLITGTYTPGGLLNGRTIIKDKYGNTVFDGSTKNGQLDGYAEVYKDGKLQYRGVFKNSKFDGWGELFIDENSRYVGNFIDGKKQGEGTYITNGKPLTGKWTNDSLNGDIYDTPEVSPPNVPGLIPNGSGNVDINPPPITPPDNMENNGSDDNRGDIIDPPLVIPPGGGDNETEGSGESSDNSNGSGNSDEGTTSPPIIPPEGSGNNGNVDGGGNETPPTNEEDRPIPPVEITDSLNPETIKKSILNIVSSIRNHIGIDEKVLIVRLNTQMNSEVYNSEALATIKDTNIAKELIEKVKNDMLLSINRFLLFQNLDKHRSYIEELLK